MTTQTDKATARPWEVNNTGKAFWLESKHDIKPCASSLSESNAKLIVKAVNVHEDLVEALQLLDAVFRAGMDIGDDDKDMDGHSYETLGIVRAALTKAQA